MTHNRDTELLRLRPAILANPDENEEGSPGHFQNATLRPILKFQNELLLQMFRHYLLKTKGRFSQFPASEKLDFIANSLRNDLRLRNCMIGVVIGHFTAQEWEVFIRHEQELTRRIVELLIKRLSDQLEVL